MNTEVNLKRAENSDDFIVPEKVFIEMIAEIKKLKAQLDKAEKVISHYMDLFGDRYGGKDAREYFKEKEQK